MLVLATAAGCGVAAGAVGWSPWLIPLLWSVAAAVALTAVDLRTFTLPNRIVYPSYLVVAATLARAGLQERDPASLLRAFAAMLAAGGFCWLLAWWNPGGMGLGDVKLAGVIGLGLGWFGWQQVLVAIAAAFLLAASVSSILMASGRIVRTSTVAFGPFLLVGGLLGLVWGPSAVAWTVG